jgi:protein-disulfide isomerase
MEANLGFDPNSVWQVQAIQKTQLPGINRVVVFVGDKTGKQQPYRFAFLTAPDMKHIIVGDRIIPFGEHPFQEHRTILQQRANGPYRGSASKDLELVEFADFQCPHCKAAQANMDKLVTDFPNARIVFENDPIPSIHPESMLAAEYGVCVSKLGGSTAFFTFAAAVFEGQEGLASADGATLTLNSSVTKAGLDPAKVSACANTPETKSTVEASQQLAKDLDITSVPTLAINGRQVPANAPYDTLKNIIEYQAKQDGVSK